MYDIISAAEITAKILKWSQNGSGWYALLQGYPATCFARVTPGGIELAPKHRDVLVNNDIPWSRFFDLRLFSEEQEWHAWRMLDGRWGCREQSESGLDRRYPLYGEDTAETSGSWTLYRDGRGPEVWVPSEKAGPKKLALKVWQILGESVPESGLSEELKATLVPLMCVVDARIAGFVPL